MREAVGSTFLFKIMIVFIFFFTSFLAIAINYSQAFGLKNKIISSIEKNEGYNEFSRKEIADAVSSTGYFRNVQCPKNEDSAGEALSFIAKSDANNDITGVCLELVNTAGTVAVDKNTDKVYYKVTTYVSFNLPILGNILTIPVRGETQILTNPVHDAS